MSARAILKGRLIDSRPAWARKKKPLYASLSILCPSLIVALWFAAGLRSWSEEGGYLSLLIAGLLSVMSLLASAAGFGFGVLGLVRREPLRYLAVLGLLVNSLLLVWVLQHH
jgi:hypothetical protein